MNTIMNLNRRIIFIASGVVLLVTVVLLSILFILPLLRRTSVKLTVEVPKTASVGEVIPLTLHVRNTGDQSTLLRLAGKPEYQFVVTQLDGAVVLQTTHAIQDMYVTEVLFPGGEKKYEMNWDQKDDQGRQVPPGHYRVRGFLFFTDPAYSLQTSWESIELQ